MIALLKLIKTNSNTQTRVTELLNKITGKTYKQRTALALKTIFTLPSTGALTIKPIVLSCIRNKPIKLLLKPRNIYLLDTG